MPARSTFKGRPYQCLTCYRRFARPEGLTQHKRKAHSLPVALQNYLVEEQTDHIADAPEDNPQENSLPCTPSPAPGQPLPFNSPRRPEVQSRTFKPPTRTERHPILDGTPCDADGYDYASQDDIPTPSPRAHHVHEGDQETAAEPFQSPEEFEFADFLYVKNEMSAADVDTLTNILASLYKDQPLPFSGARELYALIDSIKDGHVPWDSVSVAYNGPPSANPPPWHSQTFEIWFRDPLAYTDLMSGNWAWNQADILAKDKENHSAMFAPVILGSDKTTVSVATGQNDFYPLYASLGNLQNSARRAQMGSVALIGFLAIPHTGKDHAEDPHFRKFRRQLFHTSLRYILSSLKPYMSTPRVTKFGDGHYRRVVYGIGPYIADYPEQALLSCIVQGWCPKCLAPSDDLDADALQYLHGLRSHDHTDKTSAAFSLCELWDDYGIVGDLIPFTVHFPRADIHELITPDLLHQLIKGTFKDHLVDWVVAYINEAYTKQEATKILADIDRRIAAVPPFPGLRRFYQGRGFKQWTGNDSKALMKVILPAIAGCVPPQMVHAIRDFLDFTYLVRRSTISEDDLSRLDTLLLSFHRNREIFREVGVRDGFSLPRQHSMVHYRRSIEMFGAPNGLCSSITESKHIKAVKRPYRRSNHNCPLGQMLLINQRIDKIIAMRTRLRQHQVARVTQLPELPLAPSIITPSGEDEDGDAVDEPASMGEIKLAKRSVPRSARSIDIVAQDIVQPLLVDRVRQYLHNYTTHERLHSSQDIPLTDCPQLDNHVIYTYPSARAVFFAPSDLSGIEGMKTEHIRSVSEWQGPQPRYDCVLVGGEADEPGFRGYLVARVFLLFKLVSRTTKEVHPLALVQWYSTVGEHPCPDTGMWIVQPDFVRGRPSLDVVHLDSIFRLVHLIGVSGNQYLPRQDFDFTQSLDAFRSFYVNKYADHHSHELVS
ncbi:hypothetical protein BKA70DRAFT_1373674 [Coprinopsis sp. MPI-PUGE-AT-0042]|nr:hypothetical protein BKA70DRAFT_1373674 [Coprinopsis sp. MPI-PUGE-AT-0042]